MPEDDTQVLRDAMYFFHVYGWKKLTEGRDDRGRQVSRHADPRRICIASPSQIANLILIITCSSPSSTDYLSAIVGISDSPRSVVLQPTCITRYLISSVSTIVTGVDPDTPLSTNCSTAPISFIRLWTASKLIGRLRQDCGTKYFTFSSREEA